MTSTPEPGSDSRERPPDDGRERPADTGGHAAERLREQLERTFGEVPPGTPLSPDDPAEEKEKEGAGPDT